MLTSIRRRLVAATVVGIVFMMTLLLSIQSGGDDGDDVRSSPARRPSSHATSSSYLSGTNGLLDKLQPSSRARCAGRGHRVWLRVAPELAAGNRDSRRSPAEVVRHAAVAAGARRLLDAFADDYVTAAGRPNTSAPFFTALRPADVLVTDACGVAVPMGDGDDFRFDVVITHVDGEVPGWMSECQRHFAAEHPGRPFTLFNRFRDNGELRYAVRSVARHAAHMVRRIVLVAHDARHVERPLDAATRELVRAAGVELVVVPDAALLASREGGGADGQNATGGPLYNSMAVETLLHRVPGLTPLLLYANDDMLLGRRLSWLDVVRPLVVDGSRVADSALVGNLTTTATGLVALPGAGSDDGDSVAVSVMVRGGGGGVYVEAELIPYVERRLGAEFTTTERGSDTLETDIGADPAVRRACGAVRLRPAPIEAREAADPALAYSHAALLRRNRELARNYLGVLPTHHDVHMPRFYDRALLALLLDGAVLPGELVARTRSSRFRRSDNVNPLQLATWQVAAENHRRRVELMKGIGSSGGDRITGDGRGGGRVFPCAAREEDEGPPRRHHDSVLTVEHRLMSPVVVAASTGEYDFSEVRNGREIEFVDGRLHARPRLWTTVNDEIRDVREPRLPDRLLRLYDSLLRTATQEGTPHSS